jgi:hydrogenase maturation protease
VQPRILVAGVGNVFYGDDAFGVEVARRLARLHRPGNVDIVEFGVRGLDLAFALLDDAWDEVVLIDAIRRGDEPGTLSVVEPDPRSLEIAAADPGEVTLEMHRRDPEHVLRSAIAMGGRSRRVTFVGCEPGTTDPADRLATGMSPPVRAAVEPAAALVLELVGDRSTRPDPRDKRLVLATRPRREASPVP